MGGGEVQHRAGMPVEFADTDRQIPIVTAMIDEIEIGGANLVERVRQMNTPGFRRVEECGDLFARGIYLRHIPGNNRQGEGSSDCEGRHRGKTLRRIKVGVESGLVVSGA